MKVYWIIECENSAGRRMFLTRVRPTHYVMDIANAKHFDEDHVAVVSRWLINLGVSHTLRQISIP